MKGYYDYSVFYFILNMQKMENSNIFRLFERGERQISKAHRSAVLLVGMGKSGASSAFNWITRKRMGVVEDAFGPYFQNTTEEGAAEISSEFPTTTICPNFAELSEGVSLIDMPNYCSHRNYIGQISAAYFYKACFQSLSHLKFVIVIDMHKFVERSCDGVINTFREFLNMFDLQKASEKFKESFFESISVLVSRGERSHQYQAELTKVRRMLSSPQLITQKKELIIELIDKIILSNRIDVFPLAKFDEDMPLSNIIQCFNRNGWQFIRTTDLEKQQLVVNQFQTIYKELIDSERKEAVNVFQGRIKCLIEWRQIMESLFTIIHDSFSNFINEASFNYNATLSFNFSSFFACIQQFLKTNDVYERQQELNLQARLQGKSISIIDALKIVYLTWSTFSQLPYCEFSQKMSFLPTCFSRVLTQISIYLAIEEEEKLIIARLIFILNRSFIQFAMIYQFHPSGISDLHHIQDYFWHALQNCNICFRHNLIFNDLNWQLLFKLFSQKYKGGQKKKLKSQLQQYKSIAYVFVSHKDYQPSRSQQRTYERNIFIAQQRLSRQWTWQTIISNYFEEYQKIYSSDQQEESQFLLLKGIATLCKDFKNCTLSKYYFLRLLSVSEKIKLSQTHKGLIAKEIEVIDKGSFESPKLYNQIIGREVSIDQILTITEVVKLFEWEASTKNNQSQQIKEEEVELPLIPVQSCDNGTTSEQKYEQLRKIMNSFVGIKNLSLDALTSKLDEISNLIQQHKMKYPVENDLLAIRQNQDPYRNVINEIDHFLKQQ